MKPKNWNKLDDAEKEQIADNLLKSYRGIYILGQALGIAIREMNEVDAVHREVSNIQDMEILQEMFFPDWAGAAKSAH